MNQHLYTRITKKKTVRVRFKLKRKFYDVINVSTLGRLIEEGVQETR